MGCGSSQEVSSQQNNVASNGQVTSNNNVPKANEKRRGSGHSSSSSSSSDSSRSNTPDKPREEKPAPDDQVDAVVVTTSAPKDNPSSSQPQTKPSEAKEPSSSPSETKPDSTQDGQEKPKFDEEVLKAFVDLETKIKDLGNDNDSIRYAQYQRLLDMYNVMKAQEKKVGELKQQTIKEYQDIQQVDHPSVRAMFANENQRDAQLAKETQEYLDALNRQEVAEQELTSLKEQYRSQYKAYNDKKEGKGDGKMLQELQFKQEELLGKIFNDSYGSDKEWKLEMELDLVGEKKERIQNADYKWSNARKFIYTALTQMNWAARRWAQIGVNSVRPQMVIYQMCAETRNHFVAASQNIKASHKFLEPIRVPYYTQDDMSDLDAAINTIFHDVQIPKRYLDAHKSYVDHYNKCRNLVNWIDQVLKSTINPDLNDTKKAYHEKYFELKEERITLIQARVKEQLGIEMTLDVKKEEYKEETCTSSEQQSVVQPGEVGKEEGEEQAPDLEAESEEPPSALPDAPTSTETAGEPAADGKPKVKAVPLAELAPAPNQEDLFGDINELKKKHEEEIAEFEKAQDLNKARIEQGLQEKLRARRSRRRKVQTQQAETAVLTGENEDSLPVPLE